MKKLAALGFIAAFCTSCLPVPFDLGVSQSVATAARMTRDNPSTITTYRNSGPDARNFVFFPQVLASGGFDYSAGFVTSQDTLSVGVQALVNGSQVSGWGQPIPNPDPHAPAYLGWPVKSGTSFLFGVVFDALDPASSGYALFQATPPSVFTFGGSSLLNLVTPLGIVNGAIGASVSASSSSTFDLLHVLATGPTSYLEASFQVKSSGIGLSTLLRSGAPLSFLPAGIKRVMYLYDDNAAALRPENRSFASWYDESSASWVSWAWWEQPVGTLHSMQLSASHRLDALLSTGQLLSTEDGVGRLYDRDGNLLATFPLGNLTYIAEEYVGGVSRCYFSQCLIYDQMLHFNVYWIQTDQLGTLGK